MENITLEALGWDSWFEERFMPYKELNLEPARIIVEHKERYRVAAASGEMAAGVKGKFIHTASAPSDFPKTGDWVAVSVLDNGTKALIHGLLPRRTCFSRRMAGEKVLEQVLAANIDVIIIVQGLDMDFNRMRLLRYVVSLKDSGITPVVVLNKADINPGSNRILMDVRELISPVKAVSISAKTGEGMDGLKALMQPGKTYGFAGSSGAGKSTIINAVAGKEIAATGEVREDDSRGRHTTVTRQLYILGRQGILIDTPGMRELQIWAEDGKLGPGFDIVASYAEKCRYRDCTHENEPGCSVKDAAEKGLIAPEVLASYYKLRKEMEFTAAKIDEKAAVKRKKDEKKLSRAVKNYYKYYK